MHFDVRRERESKNSCCYFQSVLKWMANDKCFIWLNQVLCVVVLFICYIYVFKKQIDVI